MGELAEWAATRTHGRIIVADPRDAFGRIPTSDPITMFDSTHQADKSPLLWEETITGGGAASTHLPNESAVRMRVTANADSVVRQSRAYHRYQPGKSQLVAITFDAGAATANTRQRIGLFDSRNGCFVQRTGTANALVQRSYVTGQAVDTPVAQADWNIDPFDGTGPSGITLDLSKAQIFWVRFQWLGVGAVTCGFNIDGENHAAHSFVHANRESTVYATTMSLPIRYENVATGTPAAANDLKAICSVVISEGGFEDGRGYPCSTGNGAAPISVTTRRPILSIRPAATFNSLPNRNAITLDSLDITASGNSAYWEIVYNGVPATTPSWAAVDSAYSEVEVDKASTAISGGHVIQSGYVTAGQGSTRQSIKHGISSRLPITLDAAGGNPIPVSVVVTSLTGTASVSAALNWRSLR